jgi:hypothetical protein
MLEWTLLLLIIAYAYVGFYFSKPVEWNLLTKIVVHIFWLPIVVALYSILYFTFRKK